MVVINNITNNRNKVTINKSNKKLWAPMIIIQGYLFIIFLLFVFGPWPWPVQNRTVVYSFIILYQIMLLFGFYLSVRSPIIKVYTHRGKLVRGPDTKNNKFITFLIVLSLSLFIPIYMDRLGVSSFTFNQFLNNFINGLVDPGTQYYNKLNNYATGSSNMLILFVIAITSPLRWLLIPLSIIKWSEIKLICKLGVIIYLILDILSWISIGTNKGIFDNVFILGLSLYIKLLMKNNEENKLWITKKSKRQKVVLVAFVFIMLSLAITYMTKAIASRVGNFNDYNFFEGISVDIDSPIMVITPSFLKDTVIILSSYVTQGYYGMSLAMNEAFSTTYGLGNSFFLLNIYERLTGDETLIQNTYPFKIIKYGWDPYINWHSVYTWIASDFSFYGVILIMFLLGYFFGEIWKSVLIQKNIYAVGLFILYMIMFIYIPANNQIFAFINTFTAFWGLFALWFFSSKFKILSGGSYE